VQLVKPVFTMRQVNAQLLKLGRNSIYPLFKLGHNAI
jgi:hypothetical protein